VTTHRTADGSRLATPVTAVVGAACAVAAGLSAGRPGVYGALVATAVVVGFFWFGLLPLLVVRGEQAGPAFGLGVLLLTYTFRLAAALLVLRLLTRSGTVDRHWLGLTVIACALAWSGTHVALVRRTQNAPTLDIQP
jgi:ATP synthase protein I